MKKQQKILVLGLGASGYAAAKLALDKGDIVVVFECADNLVLKERASALRKKGVKVFLGYNADCCLANSAENELTNSSIAHLEDKPDIVVISPGIAADSILGKIANQVLSPVVSELEYASREAVCPILAITGTNGKTTTVELIVHCLQVANYKTMAAGNIGIPFSEIALQTKSLDFLIIEVSSFQLERIEQFRPLVAAIINISPDHLDRYNSMDEYIKTKYEIFKNMDGHNIVINKKLEDNDLIFQMLKRDSYQPTTFATTNDKNSTFYLNSNGYLCWKDNSEDVELLHHSELNIKGLHNIENVLAALTICYSAGVKPTELVPGLKSFAASPHRIDYFLTHNGITFVNDSKATNVDAMHQGISTVAKDIDGKIILIAGGLNKEMEFTSLLPLLKDCVKNSFLIGESRLILQQQWQSVLSCKECMSLESAVDAAIKVANPGDAVMLCPGCASQDMFKNYAERGELFCELVRKREVK